jgi:hypothetical protein
MASSATCGVDVVELTEQQARGTFDKIARREMHMSGTEFLKRLDAGEFNGVDIDSVDGLADVWMALPLVR